MTQYCLSNVFRCVPLVSSTCPKRLKLFTNSERLDVKAHLDKGDQVNQPKMAFNLCKNIYMTLYIFFMSSSDLSSTSAHANFLLSRILTVKCNCEVSRLRLHLSWPRLSSGTGMSYRWSDINVNKNSTILRLYIEVLFAATIQWTASLSCPHYMVLKVNEKGSGKPFKVYARQTLVILQEYLTPYCLPREIWVLSNLDNRTFKDIEKIFICVWFRLVKSLALITAV